MKVIITADDFTVPAGTVLDVGPEVPRAFEGKCRVYVEPVKVNDVAMRIVGEVAPAIVAQNTKPKKDR